MILRKERQRVPGLVLSVGDGYTRHRDYRGGCTALSI